MREIKFRAWEPDAGEMVYFDNAKAASDIYQASHLLTLMANQHTKGKDLLMQYTGLKDKNGVEMYEGDIVKDAVGRIWVVEYSEVKASFVFSWNKNRKKEQSYFRFNRYQRPLNVIGNIHENPELLESNND